MILETNKEKKEVTISEYDLSLCQNSISYFMYNTKCVDATLNAKLKELQTKLYALTPHMRFRDLKIEVENG